MKYRSFGPTELSVSEIGLGTAGLGSILGGETRESQLRMLQTALDLGINFYDTANIYCQGESERMLAAAFRHQRDRVIIASKAGYRLPARRQALSKIKPLLRPVVHRLGLKRERLPVEMRSVMREALYQDFSQQAIIEATEGSLRRLNTDYIDLLQLHSPPRSIIESGDYLPALETLQRQGKIRYYGISCERSEDVIACLAKPGLAALQIRISLLDQVALERALPLAARDGLAVIARECFAGGLLSSPAKVMATTGVDPGSEDPVVAFRVQAQNQGWSLPKLALRSVLDAAGVSVAVIGMSSEAHLRLNISYLEN